MKVLAEFPEPKGQVLYDGDNVWVSPRAIILWDTSKDGAFPEAQLPHVGYLKREGQALVVDTDKKAAHDAKVADKAAKDADKASRKTALDAIDHTKKLSSDDMELVCREWLKREKGL